MLCSSPNPGIYKKPSINPYVLSSILRIVNLFLHCSLTRKEHACKFLVKEFAKAFWKQVTWLESLLCLLRFSEMSKRLVRLDLLQKPYWFFFRKVCLSLCQFNSFIPRILNCPAVNYVPSSKYKFLGST